jgi:hypothetical protein
MNRKLVAVALALAALAAAALVPASVPAEEGVEVSREDYVARAEPICKQNVLANRRIFKGAKAEVKAGKLKLASRHFLRAAVAFAATIRQLAALQQPSADVARIQRWLAVLRDEKDLIKQIGEALAAENKHRAESLSVDLNRNSSRANNAVLSFGFDYCRIEPSRFGG